MLDNTKLHSRRAVLGGIAVAAGMAVATGCTPAKSPRPSTAIVIGAGVSGLAAASHLTAAGVAVTVLEARDRVGGRVHSVGWQGTTLDLGASWIHGIKGNPITKLAENAGVQTVQTEGESEIVAPGADPRSATGIWEETIWDALSEVGGNQINVSVLDAVNDYVEPHLLSASERTVLRTELTNLFDLNYGAPPEDLSASGAYADEEFKGADVTFPRGYSGVFTPIADALTIRLSTTVTSIKATKAGVSVITKSGTYTADRVVVTVPPTVLASGAIAFDKFADAHLEVASRVPLGCLSKTALIWDRPFWEKDSDWHNIVGADPVRWVSWFSPRHGASNVLIGFNGGQPARDYEAAPPAAVQADAMDTLRQMYGNAIPEPRAVITTAWSLDPFVNGSYSFVPVGGTVADRVALSQPLEKRIYFAGEATTDRYFGTVHGAWLSGLRAAKQALKGS